MDALLPVVVVAAAHVFVLDGCGACSWWLHGLAVQAALENGFDVFTARASWCWNAERALACGVGPCCAVALRGAQQPERGAITLFRIDVPTEHLLDDFGHAGAEA